MNYLEALDVLHSNLRPRSYVEIGCREGVSLSRARCPALAVDPDFEIRHPLQAPTRIFRATSDEFFAKHDLKSVIGGPFDLAFIDGMHRAEFALRDFINLERNAHLDSVIVIDDVLPREIEWTTRERLSQAWTGDVYKLIPFLRDERPDLTIEVFDVSMKGMAVISGLSPDDRTLSDELVRHESYLESEASQLRSIDEIRMALNPRRTSEFRSFVVSLCTRPSDLHEVSNSVESRYLELLKRSLLNEIYLDDELRLLYLRGCVNGTETFDYDVYHDIRRSRRSDYEDLQATRAIGRFPDRKIRKSGFSHTMMGRKRLDSLHDCLNEIVASEVPGDFMECGVWRGGGCILMAGYVEVRGLTNRRVLVADSFDGLPKPTLAEDDGIVLDKNRYPELAVSLETVRENFLAYDLLSDDVVFMKGWFKDTLRDTPSDQLALLRLDGDLYESTRDALGNLYDRVVPGGIVIIDDYGAIPACEKAVHDFFDERNETLPSLTRIDWTGVHFTKPASA